MTRPHRLPHFSYVGPRRYFLTFCTFDRFDAFSDADAAIATLGQFLRCARRERLAILAYCIMPDHAHLLVEGLSSTSDLCRFAKLAKQYSGFAYRRLHGRPLWQEWYHERVLRETDDLKAFARYVVNNPVRAGLVEIASEYPFVGSEVWPVAELIASL